MKARAGTGSRRRTLIKCMKWRKSRLGAPSRYKLRRQELTKGGRTRSNLSAENRGIWHFCGSERQACKVPFVDRRSAAVILSNLSASPRSSATAPLQTARARRYSPESRLTLGIVAGREEQAELNSRLAKSGLRSDISVTLLGSDSEPLLAALAAVRGAEIYRLGVLGQHSHPHEDRRSSCSRAKANDLRCLGNQEEGSGFP
jgi:hypothetical protein